MRELTRCSWNETETFASEGKKDERKDAFTWRHWNTCASAICWWKKVMLHFITFYGCSRFLFLMSSLLFPFHLFFEWSFLITFFSYFSIFTVFSLFSKTFFLVWFTVLFLFIVFFSVNLSSFTLTSVPVMFCCCATDTQNSILEKNKMKEKNTVVEKEIGN